MSYCQSVILTEEVRKMEEKKTIKELCASSWVRKLEPEEVERLIRVKRQKVRSDLVFNSLQDFVWLDKEEGTQPILTTIEAYYSVVYLWNGHGFSAMKPFCECGEGDGEIHPLHVESKSYSSNFPSTGLAIQCR